MTTDLELLGQYARENRQEAFAELLDRHLKLVYSAALRQVRSPELAEEVAQSVFTDLARRSGKLKSNTILPAWLYEVTRCAAIGVVRRESRRQRREQTAYDLSCMNSSPPEWIAIEPLLDEAMESLEPPDRTAILLRFFEDMSLREVGRNLGTTEDAAQKRISRALERLRAFFSKRGKAVGAGGLAALLSTHAAQSAPAGLKAAILSGFITPVLGTATLAKTLAMTTLQKTFIGAALVAAVGTGLYQKQRASVFEAQLETLRRQSALANAQSDPSLLQLNEAHRQLALLQAQNEKLRKEAADVARLRGEVVRLRENGLSANGDPTTEAVKSWLGRIDKLKERLQQTPEAKIPEFQFLTQKDWLWAARNELNTSNDFRGALSTLRDYASSDFVSTALQPALKQYAQANGGQFPTDLSQLKSYFNPPVDDDVLQRWEVAPKSTVPSVGVGDPIITQVAPVDADHDNRYVVGPNGSGSTGAQDWDQSSSNIKSILTPAFAAYMAANNGSQPTDPSQLTPYLTTPAEQAALQKLIQQRGAK